MRIEPISKETLKYAILLRNKIFPDLQECEKGTLEASLIQNGKYKECDITYLKYFVMLDEKKVIGLTGIYIEENDNIDECWLGWFCIDEKYRGKGLGQKLLDFSISKAKELNKKILKLYTYDSKEFQAAIILYKKNNFIQYKKHKKELYFKLNLV